MRYKLHIMCVRFVSYYHDYFFVLFRFLSNDSDNREIRRRSENGACIQVQYAH